VDGTRASDTERERVAERLREACLEGRLAPDELDERLAVAFAARTRGELTPLLADLPSPVAERPELPAGARPLTPARRRPSAARLAGGTLAALVTLVVVLGLVVPDEAWPVVVGVVVLLTILLGALAFTVGPFVALGAVIVVVARRLSGADRRPPPPPWS
jgi:hypothetical protein